MSDLRIKLANLQDRVNAWQFSKLWYLKIYDDKSKENVIMSEIPNYQKYLDRKAEKDISRQTAVEYLFLHEEPFLDKDQEQHLFRQYNFIKYKYKQLATKEIDGIRKSQLINIINKLETYYTQLNEIKKKLVCANCRLVMSIAKKWYLVNFDSAVSEGYTGLTAAVDYFDFRKGVRFTTYSHNVIEDYIRKFRFKEARQQVFTNHESEDFDWEIPDPSSVRAPDIALATELRNTLDRALSFISPREQQVISFYYGLEDGRCLTLDEIGTRMRISKERVRQIRIAGLERMKRCKELPLLDVS